MEEDRKWRHFSKFINAFFKKGCKIQVGSFIPSVVDLLQFWHD